MSFISYFILANPSIRSRLENELEEPMSRYPEIVPTWAELKKVPILQALIKEGLRLSYGVMHRLPRCSPDVPIQYRQWTIPVGVPVGISSYFMHTDASVYERPFEFIPERWLGDFDSAMNRNYVPFSRGSRNFLGMNALPILREGYKNFKESMFMIRRVDTDILIISNKYVEELRALPKLNAIEAHVKSLVGPYTTTDLMLEGNLHTRVLQAKLTPSLSSMIPVMQDELDYALSLELPTVNEPTEINIYDILLRVVARVSARIFVGVPMCRNKRWLEASIQYTENVFLTALLLRMVPPSLRPIVQWLLPSSYRLHRNLRLGKRLTSSLVDERRELEAKHDASYEKPMDVLQWMMDAAEGDEGTPSKLAHRQLLLTIASIHTTTIAATHAMYNLYANSKYFDPLIREIKQQLDNEGNFNVTALNDMRKLDSFMKELQRLNPLNLIAFNRVVKEPITLSDGVYLPRNTLLSVASAPILIDPTIVPNPQIFDPLRSYRKRLESPEETNRHQFWTTTKNDLHFGHGKYACPGRFFAANKIKMILSRLLLKYEFEYPLHKGRLVNYTAHESVYPDLRARLVMKKRL